MGSGRPEVQVRGARRAGWRPLPAPWRIFPRPQAWLQAGTPLVFGRGQSHSSPRELCSSVQTALFPFLFQP